MDENKRKRMEEQAQEIADYMEIMSDYIRVRIAIGLRVLGIRLSELGKVLLETKDWRAIYPLMDEIQRALSQDERWRCGVNEQDMEKLKEWARRQCDDETAEKISERLESDRSRESD